MKSLHIYRNHNGVAPIIFLNVGGDETGADVWAECERLGVPAVTLAAIGGISWDEELTPWAAPPVFKGNHFTGDAQDYLSELTQDIMPRALAECPASPSWSAIAGYSLAGLFAVYAAYRTDVFRGVISASGSLWYPDFTEYMAKHAPGSTLQYAYFSLGSREHMVRNPLMSGVLTRTHEAQALLDAQGIHTAFQEEEGNHFREPALRVAKGIRWMVQRASVRIPAQ